MFLTRWLCGPERARHNRSTPRPGFRPAVESLEDRSVPAVFNLLADPAASNSAAVNELITAITLANTNGESNTINLFAGATYTLREINNYFYGPNGLPAIHSDLTINGRGATITRGTGSDTPLFRFFYVSGGFELPAGSLTLNDLMLTNGFAVGGDSRLGGGGMGAGGAIFNQGIVVLNGVTLTQNAALGGRSGLSSLGAGGGGMGESAIGFSGGGFGPGFASSSLGGAGAPGTPADDEGNGGSGGSGGGFLPGANGGVFGGGLGGFGDGIGDGGGGGSTPGDSRTEDGGAGGSFGMGGADSGGGGGVGGGGAAGAIGGDGGFGGGGGGGGTGIRSFGSGGFGGFGGGGGTSGGRSINENGGFGGGFGGSDGAGLGGGAGAGMGGAIFNMGAGAAGAGTLTVINSTLAYNFAVGGTVHSGGGGGGAGLGGAIFNLDGSVNLLNSTLAYNGARGGASAVGVSAEGEGGAIYNLAFGNNVLTGLPVVAQITLANTILANSTDSSPSIPSETAIDDILSRTIAGRNINSTSVSATGPNLIRNADGGTAVVGTAPITGTDPKLDTVLRNNGGPTQTLALLAGSPAIDAGSSSAPSTADQRGTGFARVSGSGIDLGAFEVQQPASPSAVSAPSAAPAPPAVLSAPAFSGAQVVGRFLALTGASVPGGAQLVPVPLGSSALFTDLTSDGFGDVVLFLPNVTMVLDGRTGRLMGLDADDNGDGARDLMIFNPDGTTTRIDGRTGLTIVF